MSEQETPKNLAQISDGYHTFAELYEHRHALFVALCRQVPDYYDCGEWFTAAWRSREHADGTMFDGWFVMGLGQKPGLQITYHLPMRLWSVTDFARTLDRAPEWDGHTSDDVVARLWALGLEPAQEAAE